MNLDDELRDIVLAEAERVHPGPEGWDRIREGVRARRRRTAWLRGGLAFATALSLAGFATLVVLRDDPKASLQQATPAQSHSSPTAPPTPTTQPAGAMPATFVAVDGRGTQQSRLAVFDSTTGSAVLDLSDPQPGGGPFAPSLSPDGKTVVYGAGAGTCGAVIMSVPVAGGPPRQLVGAEEGAASTPAMGAGLAYFQTRCGRTVAENRTDLVVELGGTTRRFPVSGTVRGGLSWVDHRFLVYVTEAEDGRSTIHNVDSTGELDENDPRPDPGCEWQAATVRPLGPDRRDAIVAYELCNIGQQGKQYGQLVQLDADGLDPQPLLRLDERAVQWLDFDASGRHLLIWRGGASVTGPIELWSGTGDPRPFTHGPEFPVWH